ncbi:MAG TPA: RNA polymerase factor sigma-54 [Beijerinckiaceae bacterium]|nr:RNA polymerase factor sigma-54 [Beijerinckiaceae bacterium]
MALMTRLALRQGHSLVMTPQLLQAIKLLQFSNVELAAFVEEELERNPLLERVEETEGQAAATGESYDGATDPDGAVGGEGEFIATEIEPVEGDWSRATLETDQSVLAADLGGGLDNTFDDDRGGAPRAADGEASVSFDAAGLSATSWTGSPGGIDSDGEAANLEAYVAAQQSLHDHLADQVALACPNPIDRMIGLALVDGIDEAGYLTEKVEELAARLGTPVARVEKVLAIIHTFEPTGVGARDLAECLAIQLIERDRYDPAMQILVAHLPLLAKRDFASLRRLCHVDEEDLADMVAEIRRLDPKPGRVFASGAIQSVVPDVTVRLASDGSWHVELNAEGLPRLLVNQTYAARVSRTNGTAADKSFVANCLQTANWLTKSLEQRARTILKVASEIVRHQDAFFAHGVEHLRPLNLKTIADAIGMHESTVSRVTSNKYLACPRGLFELKYFFTASIPARSGSESHSAEAVRFRIRQLIDQECADDILSDDAIVVRLKEANVDIARRTVAKYRESLRIPSSVERRREKQALQPRSS